MWTVHTMRRPRGPGLDPLLIQIYIPTREYIPTIHSAHVTIQMLALHSKINIFTQKKGINNLWGGKKHLTSSNSKLLRFCSHLVTSLHITVNNCPLPAPAPNLAFLWRHLKLPAWPWMPYDVFHKGESTAARWHLEAYPTLKLGLGDPNPAPTVPCWDINL